MLACLLSAALQGIDAELVSVEVNANETGEPKLILVGLPDAAVKESDDRVFSALGNSAFQVPRYRTTVNLAPGDLRKEGPFFDLPLALGILIATGQIQSPRTADYLIAGELSLSGATRPVRGALALARLAARLGKRGVLLPRDSAAEAALVEGIEVHAVGSLRDAADFLAGLTALPALSHAQALATFSRPAPEGPDFADVKGQHAVRRAAEIAAAGAHNLLLVGPPGSGKSMIAKRLPSLLPPATLEESLEILSVHSAAGTTLRSVPTIGRRPVRSPHHTISDVGLIGGGAQPGPGEISLAHHGVLFLDELPEFRRSALEVLRQPMEDHQVTISRSAGKVTLPCSFMLVAALNPCPCGLLGDPRNRCRCSPSQVQRYRSRVSGPLLDRIDLHVEAPALSVADLRSSVPGESSATIRVRVESARRLQAARLGEGPGRTNARMSHGEVRTHCLLTSAQGDLLQSAMEKLGLSARAYDRILKVARTIADLASSPRITDVHLLEAIQYRDFDRQALP